jgi:hypothetical protein
MHFSAASSAKKPRSGSLFQRIPKTAPCSVFAQGWPILRQHSAKDDCFCSFNRLVRQQSVPLFRQEEIVESRGRPRLVHRPPHSVSNPASTCVSVDRQVYRQGIGLNGLAAPEAGTRARKMNLKERLALALKMYISLKKFSELESIIRNAKSSAETPSFQASAGGGQQSSFPAAVELDPSRAALKNNEALSRQNDEIKPADLVKSYSEFFLGKFNCVLECETDMKILSSTRSPKYLLKIHSVCFSLLLNLLSS